MLGIKFRFDRKMRPREESQPNLLLLKICGERSKKYESLILIAAQCLLYPQTKETMNTMFILRETINGENPPTSSEIESTPKVKPQNSKMISNSSSLFLSSPNNFFSLSYVLQLSVSECVINYREDHSLFILIPNLTITH